MEALDFFGCKEFFKNVQSFAKSRGLKSREATEHGYLCHHCTSERHNINITLAFLWAPYFFNYVPLYQSFLGRPWSVEGKEGLECGIHHRCSLKQTTHNTSEGKPSPHYYSSVCDQGDVRTAAVRWQCGTSLNSLASAAKDSPFITIQGAGIHDLIHYSKKWLQNESNPEERVFFRDTLMLNVLNKKATTEDCWRSNTVEGGIDILLPPMPLQRKHNIPDHWSASFKSFPLFDAKINLMREALMDTGPKSKFNRLFNYTAPCFSLPSETRGPWATEDGMHYHSIVYRACFSKILAHLSLSYI